jgi:hypothetical protein
MEYLLLTLLTAGALRGQEMPQAPPPSYLYEPAYAIDDIFRGAARPYVPQPGDIMLATDKNFFWKITHDLAFAFEPHNSGIVVGLPDGSLGVLEAGPDDCLYVRINPLLPHLKHYSEKGPIWIRRRKTPLTPEQSAALTSFALRQNGKWFALPRLGAQLTIFRSRGPLRTYFLGKPQGDRISYFCSELVTESLVASGQIDPTTARPAATYPHDLFFEKSLNFYLRHHFSLADCWDPPARWVCQPVGGTCVNSPPAVLGYPLPDPPARLGIPY